MKAKYTQSVLGTGNPYVEALPRRMSVPELYVALEGAVRRGKNDTKLPAEERLTLTARIFDVHLPMQSSAIIYNLLYQAILSSYAWEDTDAVRQTVLLKQYQDSKGELGKMRRTAQAKSYSVLGVPGIGKSTTICNKLLKGGYITKTVTRADTEKLYSKLQAYYGETLRRVLRSEKGLRDVLQYLPLPVNARSLTEKYALLAVYLCMDPHALTGDAFCEDEPYDA